MKYKIGDKVKIIAIKTGHGFAIGKVVTITHLATECTDYCAEGRDKDCWWLREDEIESYIETLKVGDKLVLHNVDYEVTKAIGESLWFLNNNKGCDRVFNLLDIKRFELQQEILGYYTRGGFPYCKSLEDLTKFVEAIKNYKKQTEINSKPTNMIKQFRLKEQKYTKAVQGLLELTDNQMMYFLKIYFEEHSDIYQIFTSAGVMHWFEEVPEETIIDMGHFTLTIKEGKVFHNNEDITDYVKTLVESYNNLYSATFGTKHYHARISDVIFSSTGCKQHESKLSDWKKVYDLIK